MKRRRLFFTSHAEEDLLRLYEFLADKDPRVAARALKAIRRTLRIIVKMPFLSRKLGDDPFLREAVIPFGAAGYVALFRIAEDRIAILGVRHQREDDYE